MPIITLDVVKLAADTKKNVLTRLAEIAAQETGVPVSAFTVVLREHDKENVLLGNAAAKNTE